MKKVQTDKTGKRPLARIPVQYGGKGHGMCPYYPGYRFWWSGVDDALADNVIGEIPTSDELLEAVRPTVLQQGIENKKG